MARRASIERSRDRRRPENGASFSDNFSVLIFYAFAVYLLHRAKVSSIIITRQHDAAKRRAESSSRNAHTQVSLSSDQMEEVMFKRPAAIVGTLAVLFAVGSLSDRAQAGASASAPSKNTRASQLAAQQANHKTAKNDFAITEYSSSSARNRSH